MKINGTMFTSKTSINLCIIKQSTNRFYMHCLQCITSEEMLPKHHKTCSKVNGK